ARPQGVCFAQAALREVRPRRAVPQDRREGPRGEAEEKEATHHKGHREHKGRIEFLPVFPLCSLCHLWWTLLMPFDTHTLLDRFLRYVRIDTKADDRTTAYPSSPGQLVLGKMLRDELLAMGVADAVQDEHGLVFATVPGNVPGAPTIAFNAHVDTNPE